MQLLTSFIIAVTWLCIAPFVVESFHILIIWIAQIPIALTIMLARVNTTIAGDIAGLCVLLLFAVLVIAPNITQIFIAAVFRRNVTRVKDQRTIYHGRLAPEPFVKHGWFDDIIRRKRRIGGGPVLTGLRLERTTSNMSGVPLSFIRKFKLEHYDSDEVKRIYASQKEITQVED